MKSGTASVEAIDAERDRIGGPADHEHEDQPHVVRLPDRAHRMEGVLAQLAPVRAAPAEEEPEPRAEVGAAEHGVGGEADEASGRAATSARLIAGLLLERRARQAPQDPGRGGDQPGVDERRASRTRPGSRPHRSPPPRCASPRRRPTAGGRPRSSPSRRSGRPPPAARRRSPRGRTTRVDGRPRRRASAVEVDRAQAPGRSRSRPWSGR